MAVDISLAGNERKPLYYKLSYVCRNLSVKYSFLILVVIFLSSPMAHVKVAPFWIHWREGGVLLSGLTCRDEGASYFNVISRWLRILFSSRWCLLCSFVEQVVWDEGWITSSNTCGISIKTIRFLCDFRKKSEQCCEGVRDLSIVIYPSIWVF